MRFSEVCDHKFTQVTAEQQVANGARKYNPIHSSSTGIEILDSIADTSSYMVQELLLDSPFPGPAMPSGLPLRLPMLISGEWDFVFPGPLPCSTVCAFPVPLRAHSSFSTRCQFFQILVTNRFPAQPCTFTVMVPLCFPFKSFGWLPEHSPGLFFPHSEFPTTSLSSLCADTWVWPGMSFPSVPLLNWLNSLPLKKVTWLPLLSLCQPQQLITPRPQSQGQESRSGRTEGNPGGGRPEGLCWSLQPASSCL